MKLFFDSKLKLNFAFITNSGRLSDKIIVIFPENSGYFKYWCVLVMLQQLTLTSAQ